MDLRWILLFLSVIIIAMIAWHGTKISLFNFKRRKKEQFLNDYHEESQGDLFPEHDLLDELPNPPRNTSRNEIFWLNLKAPEGHSLGGEQLVAHLNRAGLRFGEFNIFHYENLFSLASAFEPGTFDLDKLDSFRTKGLTFFMETAHLADVREAFETMLKTAEYLADQLGGQLCDDKWQPLDENILGRYYDQMDELAS